VRKLLKMVGSRKALNFGVLSLLLIGITFSTVIGYIAYKEGWLTPASPTGNYVYYDPTTGITKYFKTKAEFEAYVAGLGKSTGTGGKYPISGKILVINNGTLVNGVTVEIYMPTGTKDLWNLADSVATDTAGVFTSSTSFDIGSRIMIHVVRSATKYIYDRWLESQIPPITGNLLTAPLGVIYVYTYPIVAGNLVLALYTATGTAVSTSDHIGAYTSLSKATGAANFGGYAQLTLAETYTSYGQDPWTQPATSRGHEKRDLVTVVTVAFNISGISWKDSAWSSVSVSSGMKRALVLKGTTFNPAVLACDVNQPKRIMQDTKFDMSALTSNTGVKIDIVVMDYQLWDNVKDNAATTTIGVNFGYTIQKTASFYVYVTA